MSSSLWQIHLLGGLHLVRGQETITRFRSQKFGALLAYLALFPNRLHSREELADLLWPEADPDAARVNFRTALSSLRRQLEPPGDAAGSVLVVDGRTHVHLNREAIRTDVADFEAALTAAARTRGEASAAHLSEAIHLYAGPLLPGCYETWALSERDRLAEAYLRALSQLADLREQAGDADQALDYARRAVSADPLREEGHAAVIRLLMQSGQAAAAKRQFDELSRLLLEHFDSEPEPETKALLSRTLSSPVTLVKPTTAPVPAVRAAAPAVPSSEAASSPDTSAPSQPAPASVEAAHAVPENFPIVVSRFFGREEEIEALRARLTDSQTRLVTITGPGGSGKTRVATETARTLGSHFVGGLWFVSLVDVQEAERFPEALAMVLGIDIKRGGQTGSDFLLLQITEALLAASAKGQLLVVLDNFEQLAESASGMVADLLFRVPSLNFLITSRQRLRIDGEREFPLLPLPIPAHPGTPERLLEFSSVQLFVSRAQAARADFQLTGRNAASVASLCAQLEGMPLALELAAAWMSVLSPSQMLSRMTRRLDLLVSRRRDVSPRHRTLRAAIESSVTLLPDEVRRVFAALSVFRGGWTLEAAESVCEEPCALEYLTELADHSLILRVAAPDTEGEDSEVENSAEGRGEASLRFRMLETMREFAEESLQEMDNAAASRVEDRYIEFFTKLVEKGTPHLTGPDQGEWMRRLQADNANIRAMLDLLDRRNETIEALRIGGLLTGFWQIRGYLTEGRQLLSHLLERAGEAAPALLRAQALSGFGKFAYVQGDYDAARSSQDTCLEIYRARGDAAGAARTLCELGNCEMLKSNYNEAAARFEESLAGYRELGDKKGIALLLNNLGAISLAKGLPSVALPYLEESLPLSREVGHHRIASLALLNLATIWQGEGDFARARSYYEQSLSVRRDLGDEVGIGRVLEGLGTIAMEEGDADTALKHFEESLTVRRKHEDRDGLASTLLYRGLTLIKLRQDLAGGGESLRESLEVCRRTGNRHFVSYALDGLATIAAARRHPGLAVRLWASAAALRDVLGVTAKPKEVRELAQEIDTVRRELGSTAFETAWQEGRALSLDDAILIGTEDMPVPSASPQPLTPASSDAPVLAAAAA